MSLEESVTRKELDKDTSYAPNITRERPTKSKDDFWGTVMAC